MTIFALQFVNFSVPHLKKIFDFILHDVYTYVTSMSVVSLNAPLQPKHNMD